MTLSIKQKGKMYIDDYIHKHEMEETVHASSGYVSRSTFKQKALAVFFGFVTIITAGLYHAKPVDAEVIQYRDAQGNVKQAEVFDTGAGTSIGKTSDGQTIEIHGNQIIGSQGKVIGEAPEFYQQQQHQQILNNARQQEEPKYNYSTAQQYIDEANTAYKNKQYQKIINISEEALTRIEKGTLNATERENTMLRQVKGTGTYYKNK